MSRPAPLPRLEELDQTANDELAGPTEADIDAAHGMTGWSAYDVWRQRVFVPDQAGYKKPRGNS